MTNDKREFRVLAQQFTVDNEQGAPIVSGYAARFNEPSEILRDAQGRVFNEVIKPGAFTKTLSTRSDIQALIDHDPSKIIGRTSSGTLQLSEDEQGLAFRCELPDTSYGRDLAVSMKRGDIKGCSFGMFVRDQNWSLPNANGVQQRSLNEVAVFEVTVTPNPAYPTTTAELRSIFPDGVPEDIAEHQEVRASGTDSVASDATSVDESKGLDCTCTCAECDADNCNDCSCDGCTCEGCDCHNGPEFLSMTEVMSMELDLAAL